MTKEIDFKGRKIVLWEFPGNSLDEFNERLKCVIELGAIHNKETRDLIRHVMLIQGLIEQTVFSPRSKEHFEALIETWAKKRKDNG